MIKLGLGELIKLIRPQLLSWLMGLKVSS
jgi:hypothetical protein